MDIRVNNLNKSYEDNVLFKDYDLHIKSGEIVGIYGGSGSGKTTLLNIIGGIEPFEEGEVTYDNKPITRKNLNDFRRNNVSFIFQNYGLIDNMTVLDNLKTLYNYKSLVKNKEHITILEKLGIEDKIDTLVYKLSGGEQQRVAIAKATIKKAQLILADEPTASLDEDNKNIIMNELKYLNSKGATVVIVSHDLSIVESCDYIINLDAI